ncbi:hypothetical protein IWX85_003413 [Polaromonas sp. CG_9.11]|nr:hypothetical protein [Polaromonas sp. CG_9.11]
MHSTSNDDKSIQIKHLHSFLGRQNAGIRLAIYSLVKNQPGNRATRPKKHKPMTTQAMKARAMAEPVRAFHACAASAVTASIEPPFTV